MAQVRIAVIGAGVIGLSSAISVIEATRAELSKRKLSLELTVYADKFTPDTTSDGAGGFWTPYRADPPEKIKRWADVTQKRLNELKAKKWPVEECRVTTVSNKDEPLDLYFKELLKGYVVEKNGAGRAKHVVSYYAPLIITTVYMERLMTICKSLGVKFVKRTLKSVDELISTDKPDLVINCAGLGAKHLVSDPQIEPLRGVLVILRPQKQLPNRVIDDDDGEDHGTYVISRPDLCVLGGTAMKGDWNETASQEEIDGIITRCSALVPELGSVTQIKSQISKVWVGLRPGRDQVRLSLDNDSFKVPVIHNIGHGGSGWTLHWGCAEDVVALTKRTGEYMERAEGRSDSLFGTLCQPLFPLRVRFPPGESTATPLTIGIN